MAPIADSVGLFAGAVLLGAVHGVEPGHGWPVAASYALDRANKWVYGFAASLVIGVGHLISSIAMVAVFFYAKSYFRLTEVNEPIALEVLGTTVTVGGPVSIVAGLLLLLLGWREYAHGHSHGDGGLDRDHDHPHGHDRPHDHPHKHDHAHDHSHGDDHDGEDETPHGHDDSGLLARVWSAIPFVGNEDTGAQAGAATDRGLLGIAWFAFVLGFAHEEEFEIIALCAGSVYCLELMLAYALTVVAGIVGLTLLLIAGYQHYEERVERYTPYLPLFSAAVLLVMGLGFIVGVF